MNGDNEFCTAILQIVKIPDIFKDSPPFVLDDVRRDFDENGYNSDNDSVEVIKKIISNLNTISLQKFRERHIQCHFCKNIPKLPDIFKNHSLRDSAGRIICPRLRTCVCIICGASGENAHTMRYCDKRFDVKKINSTNLS